MKERKIGERNRKGLWWWWGEEAMAFSLEKAQALKRRSPAIIFDFALFINDKLKVQTFSS